MLYSRPEYHNTDLRSVRDAADWVCETFEAHLLDAEAVEIQIKHAARSTEEGAKRTWHWCYEASVSGTLPGKEET